MINQGPERCQPQSRCSQRWNEQSNTSNLPRASSTLKKPLDLSTRPYERFPCRPCIPGYPQPRPHPSHQFESDVIATLGIEDIFLRGDQAISNTLREPPLALLGPQHYGPSFTEKQTEAWVYHAHSSAVKLHFLLLGALTDTRAQCHVPPTAKGPSLLPGPTHRRVPNTAGKGHPTALAAWVQVSAVEVDIEVPVIGPSGATARPLGGQKNPE